MHDVYIYIYIYILYFNSIYIIITPTCIDIYVSSSGSPKAYPAPTQYTPGPVSLELMWSGHEAVHFTLFSAGVKN